MFLDEWEADIVLQRYRRANTGAFEEFFKGNLERECFEERCNVEEAREVFENDEKTVSNWRTHSTTRITELCTNHCTVQHRCDMTKLMGFLWVLQMEFWSSYDCKLFLYFLLQLKVVYVLNTLKKKKKFGSKKYFYITDVNQCKAAPCKNQGTCEYQKSTYICHCQPGFTGHNCEIGETKDLSLRKKQHYKNSTISQCNFPTWPMSVCLHCLVTARHCDVNNGGCMHFCSTLETQGAACSCATGYKLVEEVKCVPEGNLVYTAFTMTAEILLRHLTFKPSTRSAIK